MALCPPARMAAPSLVIYVSYVAWILIAAVSCLVIFYLVERLFELRFLRRFFFREEPGLNLLRILLSSLSCIPCTKFLKFLEEPSLDFLTTRRFFSAGLCSIEEQKAAIC